MKMYSTTLYIVYRGRVLLFMSISAEAFFYSIRFDKFLNKWIILFLPSYDSIGMQHEGLFSRAISGTKMIVEQYHESVAYALDFICDSQVMIICIDQSLYQKVSRLWKDHWVTTEHSSVCCTPKFLSISLLSCRIPSFINSCSPFFLHIALYLFFSLSFSLSLYLSLTFFLSLPLYFALNDSNQFISFLILRYFKYLGSTLLVNFIPSFFLL